MSIDEYRWISRQIYTTVAAEPIRPDADPQIRNLYRTLGAPRRGPGGLGAQADGNRNLFDPILVDFTWLKVPDSTREMVREHAGELASTTNAVVADTLLLNTESPPTP